MAGLAPLGLGFVLVVTLSGVLLFPGLVSPTQLQQALPAGMGHRLFPARRLHHLLGAVLLWIELGLVGVPTTARPSRSPRASVWPFWFLQQWESGAHGIVGRRLLWLGCSCSCCSSSSDLARLENINRPPVLERMIFTKYLQLSPGISAGVRAALGMSAEITGAGARSDGFPGCGSLHRHRLGGQFLPAANSGSGTACRVQCSGLRCLWHRRGTIDRGSRLDGSQGGTGMRRRRSWLLWCWRLVSLGARIHPLGKAWASDMGFVEKLKQEGSAFWSIGDFPLFPSTSAPAVQISDLRFLYPLSPERTCSPSPSWPLCCWCSGSHPSRIR